MPDDFVIDTSIKAPVLDALSFLDSLSDRSVTKLREYAFDVHSHGRELCTAFHLVALLTNIVKRQKVKLAARDWDARVAAYVEERMREFNSSSEGSPVEEQDGDVVIVEEARLEDEDADSSTENDVMIIERGESQGETVNGDVVEDEEGVESPFKENAGEAVDHQNEVHENNGDDVFVDVIEEEEEEEQSETAEHCDTSEDHAEASSGNADGELEEEEEIVDQDEIEEGSADDPFLHLDGDLVELDEYEEEEGEVADTDEDEEKEREWRKIAEEAQDHPTDNDPPRASTSNDSGEPVAKKRKKNKKKNRDTLFVSPPPRAVSPQLELIHLRVGSVTCVFCLSLEHSSFDCTTFPAYQQRQYIREKRGLCWHCLGHFRKEQCRAVSHMKLCTACPYQHFSHPAMCKYREDSNGQIDCRVPRKRTIVNELSNRR